MKEAIERGLAYIRALNAKLQECTSDYPCDEVTRAHGKLNLQEYHRVNQQTRTGTSVPLF